MTGFDCADEHPPRRRASPAVVRVVVMRLIIGFDTSAVLTEVWGKHLEPLLPLLVQQQVEEQHIILASLV